MISSDTQVIEQLVNHLTHQVECISNLDTFQASFLDSSSDSSTSSSSSSDSDHDTTKVNKKKKFLRIKKVKPDEQTALKKDDEDYSDDDENENKFNSNQRYLKTKGELSINELEPVAQLKIDLDDKIKLIKMGVVLSIVDDKLVVIQSMLDENQKAKPLDEETILFDSNRKCLGKIFEVFGPVTSPFYSIRFNNTKEISDYGLNVQKGAYIYYAPDSNEYTKFIFNIDELRRIKGSDASWNNDNEPPAECLEYSDDEKEKLAKKLLKQSKKTHGNTIDSDNSDSEMTDTVDSISNKKIKKHNYNNNNNNSNNNKFTKSRSNFGFNQNQNNEQFQHANNRQIMPQSRSYNNFPQQQQQNQQQFYPMHVPNQQFGPNQFMPNQGFFPYPPQMQHFNWPNPQQHNPFMNFPQMPYFQNPPFNLMQPQQQQNQHQHPLANMQQPNNNNNNNQYNFEPVSNNNNNNNRSPNKIVDKRFIQNNSNIIKKSF